MNFNFPIHFLWGSAMPGHQVEGNNVNSDFWTEGAPYKDKCWGMRLIIIDFIKKTSHLWQVWD